MRLKHLVSCSGLLLLCVEGFCARMSHGQECLVLQYRDNRPSTSVLNSLGTVSKNSCKTLEMPKRPAGVAWCPSSLRLTNWSEIYVRAGLAEFNVDEALFRGDYGFAYGGGVRLRLLPLPFGSIGLASILRFTSDDDDSVGDLVEGEWEEIDLALGIMTRFGPFEFYFGGAYHQSEITLDRIPTGTRTTLETEIPFRIFLGPISIP